jgi:hypothetical protein
MVQSLPKMLYLLILLSWVLGFSIISHGGTQNSDQRNMHVTFKLFNKARVDEKENELTSTDWMGLY